MSGADVRNWADVVIAIGLIALAIDKWVHRREAMEQSTAAELASIRKDVEELETYAKDVGRKGHDTANTVGKVQTELALVVRRFERDQERIDAQIAENMRRIDEWYRSKRNGAST